MRPMCQTKRQLTTHAERCIVAFYLSPCLNFSTTLHLYLALYAGRHYLKIMINTFNLDRWFPSFLFSDAKGQTVTR